MSKMGAVPDSYVLVTAMKNEGQMLPGLFDSVLKQSKKPVLWLIADDGSSDDGFAKAKSLAGKLPWVKVVSRPLVQNPPWLGYGSAVVFAYERAEAALGSMSLSPALVAVLDADTAVDADYFEKLVKALAADDKTAIASGMITTEGGGRLESRPAPRGCARMYRKDFLDGIGGFAVSPAYETIPEIKAANRGLSFAVAWDAKGLHRRRSTQISGAKGLRSRGIVRYCLGMDAVSALAWSSVYARVVGLKAGASFLAGYLEARRHGYERIRDEEIRSYFDGSWKRFMKKAESRSSVKDMLV
jgi:glycosyltransferase involved in cell wall biosynthesis